jgi:hypothetical protein
MAFNISGVYYVYSTPSIHLSTNPSQNKYKEATAKLNNEKKSGDKKEVITPIKLVK